MDDVKESVREVTQESSQEERPQEVGCARSGREHVELALNNPSKFEQRFGPGGAHKEAVAQLVLNGASTEKFGRAIRRLWRDVQGADNDAVEFFSRKAGGFCRIPDAYRIDRATKVVTVYEVVVASEVSRDKAVDYLNLFWMLDGEYWTLDVIEVSKHGNMTRLDILGRGTNIMRQESNLPPFTTAERFELKERTGIARDPIFDMAPPA